MPSVALLGGTLLLVLGSLYPAPAQTKKPARKAPPPKASPRFEQVVRPVVVKFCLGCHSGLRPAGTIDLDKTATHAQFLQQRDLWDRVSQALRSSHMPPPGQPAPTAAQRKQVADWIDTTLSADCAVADPGKVTLRRLNRAEYDNTIRDLLGIDFQASADFPSDDVGYGFDNIGDVLSISSLLLEKYLAAAEAIAERAIALPGKRAWTVDPDRARLDGGVRVGDSGEFGFFANGEASFAFDLPRAGQYTLKIEAGGQQAGPDRCRMEVRVDGKPVQAPIEVAATRAKPVLYELPLRLGPRQRIAVAFVNDYYRPQDPDPVQRDRNLYVNAIELTGPHDPDGALPASHRRIVVARPESDDWAPALRKVLGPLATRAYRRPATADEVERLVTIGLLAKKSGESFEKGVRLGVQAVLVSPHFLFRVENPKPGPLGGYEIASRLSYFLWSSMPDQTLFELAGKGALGKPENLVTQVRRMTKDPKVAALAENFAGQWLQLRKLEIAQPDSKLFPQFDEALKESMRAETTLFFRNIVAEDRSILEFLEANYTFLNERLARHYGIHGIQGSEFRKVTLGDARRGGLLAQASILTVTSNPTRTSPVKRGKWVLENILGTPPPPPPPGADTLPGGDGPLTGKTLRAKMEEHRKNPTCASCHSRMDPIGFGLENFDAVGAWRDREGDEEVDATGQLPDGTRFEGPASLRAYLVSKKDQFAGALAERMLTYALGRGLTAVDRCHIESIVKRCRASGYRFSALVEGVVLSDPFRKQGMQAAPSK